MQRSHISKESGDGRGVSASTRAHPISLVFAHQRSPGCNGSDDQLLQGLPFTHTQHV